MMLVAAIFVHIVNDIDERIITSSFWTRSLVSGVLMRIWRWDGLMKPSSTALSMNASSRL
jgi:hypothetical protein